jgi:hypothetical protein
VDALSGNLVELGITGAAAIALAFTPIPGDEVAGGVAAANAARNIFTARNLILTARGMLYAYHAWGAYSAAAAAVSSGSLDPLVLTNAYTESGRFAMAFYGAFKALTLLQACSGANNAIKTFTNLYNSSRTTRLVTNFAAGAGLSGVSAYVNHNYLPWGSSAGEFWTQVGLGGVYGALTMGLGNMRGYGLKGMPVMAGLSTALAGVSNRAIQSALDSSSRFLAPELASQVIGDFMIGWGLTRVGLTM